MGKLKALFARIIMREDSAHMGRNANLLMGGSS
jgi:hypothetical protein